MDATTKERLVKLLRLLESNQGGERAAAAAAAVRIMKQENLDWEKLLNGGEGSTYQNQNLMDWRRGYNSGKIDGYGEGMRRGREVGFNEGFTRGRSEGYNAGIRASNGNFSNAARDATKATEDFGRAYRNAAKASARHEDKTDRDEDESWVASDDDVDNQDPGELQLMIEEINKFYAELRKGTGKDFLKPNEIQFLKDMYTMTDKGWRLSARQMGWLKSIHKRISKHYRMYAAYSPTG